MSTQLFNKLQEQQDRELKLMISLSSNQEEVSAKELAEVRTEIMEISKSLGIKYETDDRRKVAEGIKRAKNELKQLKSTNKRGKNAEAIKETEEFMAELKIYN